MPVLHVNKVYPIDIHKDGRAVHKVFFNKQHVWKFPSRESVDYPYESNLPRGSQWNNDTRTYQLYKYIGNVRKIVDVNHVGNFRYAHSGCIKFTDDRNVVLWSNWKYENIDQITVRWGIRPLRDNYNLNNYIHKDAYKIPEQDRFVSIGNTTGSKISESQAMGYSKGWGSHDLIMGWHKRKFRISDTLRKTVYPDYFYIAPMLTGSIDTFLRKYDHLNIAFEVFHNDKEDGYDIWNPAYEKKSYGWSFFVYTKSYTG